MYKGEGDQSQSALLRRTFQVVNSNPTFLVTSVLRKSTFTGLLTNFTVLYRFPTSFQLNLIRNLN